MIRRQAQKVYRLARPIVFSQPQFQHSTQHTTSHHTTSHVPFISQVTPTPKRLIVQTPPHNTTPVCAPLLVNTHSNNLIQQMEADKSAFLNLERELKRRDEKVKELEELRDLKFAQRGVLISPLVSSHLISFLLLSSPLISSNLHLSCPLLSSLLSSHRISYPRLLYHISYILSYLLSYRTLNPAPGLVHRHCYWR